MALHELARRVGILDEYFDVGGRRCFTSDDTRRAILHAMHIDASSDEAARDSLEQLVREDDARLLAPVRVVEFGQPLPLDIRTPGDRETTGPWVLGIDLEGCRTIRVSDGRQPSLASD